MFDSPRPAHSMSASLNSSDLSRCGLRAGAVALALAATMLPGANAAPRHGVVTPHSALVHASSHGTSRVEVHAPLRLTAQHARSRGQHAAPPEHSLPSSRTSLSGRQTLFKRQELVPLSTWAMQHPDSRGPKRGREAEVIADHLTEDRVHAWYRARHTEPVIAETPADQPKVTSASKPLSRPSAETSVAARLGTAEPGLAILPQRATAEDLNRVLPKPSDSVQKPLDAPHVALAAKQTHTTADDDAAFAEASNIPSTAPTEREPAPFVHGNLLAGSSQSSPKLPGPAIKAAAPAVIHVDPRGDAEVLSAKANGAPGDVHLSTAEVLPELKPAPILRSPAPAASAVLAAAKKPHLDPALGDAVAQQAINSSVDGDSSPRKTVTLAANMTRTDALSKPALLPAVGGGYDVDLAAGPLVKVNLYDEAGKLILLPAMKGSHEILVHQNQMAVTDGLDRVEDDGQLLQMRHLGLLAALPDDQGMQPDGRLPLNRRFARPWAIRFLNDLSRAHFARFHTPLIVTSAVRTVAFQRRLVLTNGNAAPPTGEVASPHLYGQAVDIAKHGMSLTEIAWMRSYLTPIEASGKIDVEEEFQQSCFHLSVYRRYLGLPAPRGTPAPEVAPSRVLQQAKATPAKHRRIPTALLATGLR